MRGRHFLIAGLSIFTCFEMYADHYIYQKMLAGNLLLKRR